MYLVNQSSIYIHYPFCWGKCDYCDFFSVNAKPIFRDTYFKFFLEEISLIKKKFDIKNLVSIYIGGGSPSILPNDKLNILLNELSSFIAGKNDIEITLEATPMSLDIDKVEMLENSIINRLSIGIQSFNSKLFKIIGRRGTINHNYQSLEILREKWTKDVSFDLIFGIPGETIDDIKKDIDTLIEYNPDHISIYSLSIEENTSLARKKLIIDTDSVAEQYEFIMEYLEKLGYIQYEISNFARKSKESIHNRNYWLYGNYIGIGAGAYSTVNGVRWRNFTNFDRYYDAIGNFALPISNFEILTNRTQEFEYIFLGLRYIKGINFEQFFSKFRKHFEVIYGNIISDLVKDGMGIVKDGSFRLTKKGWKVATIIEEKFLI